MPSRRRFIEATLAVPTVSLVGRSAWANFDAVSGGPLVRPHRFIIDDRFRPAAEAARVAAVNDVEVMTYAGDPTPIWYYGLDRQWRERPMVLAGLTLDGGLFVLETLAADHGMRVWYHATHHHNATGETMHTVLCSGSGPDGRELEAAEHEWPRFLGTRLCEISQRAARAATGCHSTGTHLNDEATLHSWVIGPKGRGSSSGARPDAAIGDFL